MAKSTEVAVKGTAGTDIQAQAWEDAEAQLAAQNRDETDASDIQIPLLKIGHGQTAEVLDGDAVAGEFINALTRQTLGKAVTFIVAGFSKGRFDHGIRGETKARKAFGTKTVPWPDDPFYGQPWSVHPDAEERYSARANSGEISWGKGPRISTTYDFTGYVLTEDDVDPIPVCLSLMRMNTKPAKKWLTILDAVLRGRYWDCVFELSTEQHRNDSGVFYTVNVKQGRKTTPEERQQAVQLALVLRQRAADVQFVGEDDSADTAPKVEPDAAGGMAV